MGISGRRLYFSSPAIGSDDTAHVGSEDKKYAINGKRSQNMGIETEDRVDSSPAIGSDGTVYVGSDDGKLYALNGKTGVKLWEFQTGGDTFSPPSEMMAPFILVQMTKPMP